MELDISTSHKWTWEGITGGAYAQDAPQASAVLVKRQIRFKGTKSSPLYAACIVHSSAYVSHYQQVIKGI